MTQKRLPRGRVSNWPYAQLADALERPVDEILPQNDLENDLGLDSMGLIQVNVAIEEQFQIPILDGESPEFALHTVEDLTAFVAEKAETRSYQEELI